MRYRKCNQIQCIHNQGFVGCPVCPECKAKSNEVTDNDRCIECYCCEKDLGYVRGGVPGQIKAMLKEKLKKEQEQKEKPMVIER